MATEELRTGAFFIQQVGRTVAPFYSISEVYGHFGEPRYEVLFFAIGVVEVERFVEEVVSGAGDAAGEKWVEGIAVLDLAGVQFIMKERLRGRQPRR